MNYKEFLTYIKNGILELVDEGCEVSILPFEKNNGVIQDGLVIKDKTKEVSPAIYMEGYYARYENGLDPEELVQEIYHQYLHYSSNLPFSIQDFSDYSRLHKKIAYKLIHFEKNKKRLEHIPYVRFLDLAIVFFVLVDYHADCKEHSDAVFLIREEHLKLWQVDIGDIYRDALYQTPKFYPAQIYNMADMILELLEENDFPSKEKNELKQVLSEQQNEFYVLTNEKKMYGASCILYKDVLKRFATDKHCDLYLIPSSVHEMLLLPATKEISPKELKGMVKDVNHTEVDEKEILSYQVYYYHRDSDFISIT